MQKVIQYLFFCYLYFFDRLANVRPLERAAWKRDLPRPTLQLTFLESHITCRSTCCSAWSTYVSSHERIPPPVLLVVCILCPHLLWRFMSKHFPVNEQRSQDWHLGDQKAYSFDITFAGCQDLNSKAKVEHLAVATAGLSCALPRTPEPTNLTGSGAEKIIFLISLGLRTWTLLQETLRHVAGVVPNHPRPAMKNEKTCQLNVWLFPSFFSNTVSWIDTFNLAVSNFPHPCS